jgi:hypothetical protein
LFSDLPFDVQREAKREYRLFQSHPAQPGLNPRNWAERPPSRPQFPAPDTT